MRFEREWGALRAYANERGVGLIGDLPIYVAENGADHLAHPELFLDDVVAGVPPDAFTDEGQRWGNPIYDWSAMRATGYRWWIERFRRTFELHDLMRVDHFRGFVAYWAVPAESDTAKDGTWRPGPGRELFDAVAAELGALPLIAEDLGVITEPVVRLRDELGLPGMHVLQFGFDELPGQPAPAGRAPRERRRLHGHARQRHGPRLVGLARRGRAPLRPASTRPTRRGASSSSRTPRPRGSRSSRCRTCSGSAARRG